LLADDEQGFHDLFHFTFEPLGFEVVTVADGHQAVDVVREHAFDLVILDVHMPRMGGAEALQRIREIRPNQKILMISSSDIAQSLEAQMAASGAVECLYKPMDLDELLSIVERLLTSSMAQAASFRVRGTS
jgi:CheY-like chemotaxis protein